MSWTEDETITKIRAKKNGHMTGVPEEVFCVEGKVYDFDPTSMGFNCEEGCCNGFLHSGELSFFEEYFEPVPDAQECLDRIEDAATSLGIASPYGKVNTSPTGSLRFNEGKPEVSQLDPKFILDLADLITKSAEKYGRGNYAKGQMFSTPFDSCMRHLLKFQSGESFDDESLQHHLLHAAANIMILYNSWLKDNPELDDRIDFDA